MSIPLASVPFGPPKFSVTRVRNNGVEVGTVVVSHMPQALVYEEFSFVYYTP